MIIVKIGNETVKELPGDNIHMGVMWLIEEAFITNFFSIDPQGENVFRISILFDDAEPITIERK